MATISELLEELTALKKQPAYGNPAAVQIIDQMCELLRQPPELQAWHTAEPGEVWRIAYWYKPFNALMLADGTTFQLIDSTRLRISKWDALITRGEKIRDVSS